MRLGADMKPALLPGMPQQDGEPVFAEPWMAQAFAMTLALHQRGLFTWPEWAEALAAEIRAAGAADDGSRYYEFWLAALEKLVAARGATHAHALHERAEAWTRAAAATPHGRPIELANDPHARG